MKIYVASSWRNLLQQGVVHTLRAAGHEVYDYKQPVKGESGFRWSEIDPEWKAWAPAQFRECLDHPIAIHGFDRDMAALRGADLVVLVLPCGRSAHLEAGWAAGAGKRLAVLQLDPAEPELMYRMADKLLTSWDELLTYVGVDN